MSTAASTAEPALHRPRRLEDAIRILQEDSGALPLAGGQTLVSMLNLGFIQPTALVLLADVAELKGIDVQDDGSVRIGALVTHAELARSAAFRGGQRLIPLTAKEIADPAIRNFGTIGGACAHGDTVADWPAALVAADAEILVAGPGGTRSIAAAGFFENIMTTALQPAELIVAVRIPAIEGSARYLKFARVHGDYATVSVAVTLSQEDGRCRQAGIAVGACGPRPIRLRAAEALLQGQVISADLARTAGQLLADAAQPISDVRGTAEYRKRVVPRLVARAVLEAME